MRFEKKSIKKEHEKDSNYEIRITSYKANKKKIIICNYQSTQC